MVDLKAAASGGSGGSSDNCFDLDICPDLLIATFAIAAAAAFFFLYQAITMAQGRRRRRKRSDGNPAESSGILADVFYLGIHSSLLRVASCILYHLTSLWNGWSEALVV